VRGGVEGGLKKLMLDFSWGLSLQSAVTHPARGTGLENVGPSGREGRAHRQSQAGWSAGIPHLLVPSPLGQDFCFCALAECSC